MASLSDVFTESERTNWLKAWLAIDIAKSGLKHFADNAAKTIHGAIYSAVLSNGTVVCNGCHIANLLKCPTPRICKKLGAHGPCISMHNTALKQPRQCPANVCNKVFVEIAKQHRYSDPSWKNTVANDWASSPWQIAKAYFPPDGYTENRSAQDTDLNGIISFMMNCKHFNNTFSFPICPGPTHPPCLLTKTREIGRIVRHSSTCKITDTDLQDIFITLTCLLNDRTCLANDLAAQEAVRKLTKLQTDVLKLTTEEIVELLEASQNVLKKVEKRSETAIDEISIYMETCRKDMDTFKQEFSEHTGKCIQEFDENRRKFTESNYEQSCKEFQRRLKEHYNDTCSSVPLSNLDPSLDKRITDIYSTPNIHQIAIAKDGKRVKMENSLTYKQIFYTCDKNINVIRSNRRIYLQGEPGSGKSTFSAKLVHDWSQANQVHCASAFDTNAFTDVSIIQQFKFLFFITLRDSRGQTDVTQMIKKQLIDTTFSEDERADVYKLFVKIMNSEICLVLREGLDEWVSPDGSNLAEPSMAGFQRDTCTVLTTSRPWKLADERIKNSQIDILLEIEGISDPFAYSKKVIGCLTDHSKDLKETAINFMLFVKKRNIESFSSLPMLFTHIIYTWVNTIEKEEYLKESSLCALYTTLLESLCKKANSTTGYFNDSNPPPVHCFSSTSYIQPNIEHLNKLAEVACKLLFSSEREASIVFSDITLSNYFSPSEFTVRKTFALTAGILTHRKDKSRTGSFNSFVHKSVQEFLAAYHIACNTYIIDDVISRYLKLNNTSYLEISQVLIFLCGMNTSAANKLSALMNQYDVIHCEHNFYYDGWEEAADPCTFQSIIESGIREAVANSQEHIQLTLSHFHIDESNIRQLNYIWPTNTCNVKVLCVRLTWYIFLMSSARGEYTSDFEFNLSSCHTLRRLFLSGSRILRDTASSVRWDFPPVCIVLNNADLAHDAGTPPELLSIEHICLKNVTCSSTCLRRLFSTLLTLNHEVGCTLECVITSCVEGSDRCTEAFITTNVDNEFNMHSLTNDSPGLWEALHGLNIKSFSLGEKTRYRVHLNHKELFSQFLSSLTHLKKLSIERDCDISSLCKALHGININDLRLRCSHEFQYLIANHLELLSEFKLSLIRIEKLIISVPGDFPGLLQVLRGLNIKSLSLHSNYSGLKVNHVKSLSEALSSLTQLKTLRMCVCRDNPQQWEALRGLNIKSLRLGLRNKRGDMTVAHGESLSKSLSSLTQLKSLRFSVDKDGPGLWEAFRFLNIKNLSLHIKRSGLRENYVELSSKSLSSLKQLETLSIYVRNDIPNLWHALHGLNVKSLSLRLYDLRRGLRVNNVDSSLQNLLSLNQLETLSIDVDYDIPNLWNALHGLDIKSLRLRLSWIGLTHIESISQALLSFTQLETLSIVWNTSVRWEVLHGLNINSLSLNVVGNSRKNNVEFLSQVLSSLTQLETLSISVYEYIPGLWEALSGLNIKRLSLSGWCHKSSIVNHVGSLSQSLASLTQLEKLSISFSEEIPGLWGALRGLNIKKLSLSGFLRVSYVELLSNSLSSLTQLETLSIIVKKDSPGLFEALSDLNIKYLSLGSK